jgi:hypothetical protein
MTHILLVKGITLQRKSSLYVLSAIQKAGPKVKPCPS